MLRQNLLFNIDKKLTNSRIKNLLLSNNTYQQQRSFHSSKFLKESLPNKSYDKHINLYSNIKNFIQNNPHNKESQLKLEKYLVDFSYTHYEDTNILGIDISLFNKKIFNFLLPLLLNKIQKFRRSHKKDFYEKDSELAPS